MGKKDRRIEDLQGIVESLASMVRAEVADRVGWLRDALGLGL